MKFLGSLHGRGRLSIANGTSALGLVSYEIDGFVDGVTRRATGQIEAEPAILMRAFLAGGARVSLAGGTTIDVVLSDPQGGQTAEVGVTGNFPL
jgi:hypothetical protein